MTPTPPPDAHPDQIPDNMTPSQLSFSALLYYILIGSGKRRPSHLQTN